MNRNRRIAAVYLVVPALATVVLILVLRLGRDMQPAGLAVPARSAGAINIDEAGWRLFLAVAVIVVVARLFGILAGRVGQPQVVGEIVAGIVLGPSVLTAVFPALSENLFRADVLPLLAVLAQLGLVVFMFLVGLEFEPGLLRDRGNAAALISHVSIVVPFALGLVLALVVYDDLGPEGSSFLPFALMLGASMSITAFPVLARILNERGLQRTRLGATAITCAAIDDVTAWCVLAVVVALATGDGRAGPLTTIALTIAFIAFMFGVVRPGVARFAARPHRQVVGPTTLALVFAGLLLCAVATDRIGIHAIFGAFLFGAVLPKHDAFVRELAAKLRDFTVVFLLPLFFAYSGLRTQIGLLDQPGLWLTCVVVVALAIIGKWGGSMVAARTVGLSWRESTGIGVLMNCRGLTELVVLNIGLDLGIIPPVLFTMLVIMALVTTLMTAPLLDRLFPRHEISRMVAEHRAETAGDGSTAA